MKQSLQLNLGTQLTLTPQLQQAIKLLQMSTLDLQQEIQQALESNPLLEVEESFSDEPLEQEQTTLDDSQQLLGQSDNNQLPDQLPVDSQWEDTYSDYQATNIVSAGSDLQFAEQDSATETLHDHLYWQLNVTRLVDSDRLMATAIIDAINHDGFLGVEPESIFQNIQSSMLPNAEFEEFEAVRNLIQHFDPIGVASCNLQECLLTQLNQIPKNTPFRNDAITIVSNHLQLLASHDYAQLKRKTRFKEGRLTEAVLMIQQLNPTPGNIIDDGQTEYITPDVYVNKSNDSWVVSINHDCSPKLKINSLYAQMSKQSKNANDSEYIKNNLQEARWFIKSLQSRNDTLLKVATKIVEHQQGFLEYGEEAMKALTLGNIAEEIGMHESTISRATTRKYMHTHRGIFELKYFFSSHVSTDTGGECSSTAIKAMIKKLVQQENVKKPLSDNKIASILSEQGIDVARRTVAKYRESMAIAPSNERKRLG